MEEKRITVESLNKDIIIAKYKLFEWRMVEEHEHFLFTSLVFERDDQTPYHKELKELEEEYGNIPNVPFTIIFGLALLAILTITALLIVFITNRDIAKSIWLAFIIPSGILLITAMACTFLKLKLFDKVVKEMPDKNKEFAQKVKEIKK